MITIRKATAKDVKALAEVSKKAFYVPHKDVIPNHIMKDYLKNSFNEKTLLSEINNPDFKYNLIFKDAILAGFSKIIINTKNSNIKAENVTKLERIYLTEAFYGLGLGKELFAYNLRLIKEAKQKGVWLYVWIKNDRAIDFYKKAGFKKIAMYDFPISDKETRPNDVFYLEL